MGLSFKTTTRISDALCSYSCRTECCVVICSVHEQQSKNVIGDERNARLNVFVGVESWFSTFVMWLATIKFTEEHRLTTKCGRVREEGAHLCPPNFSSQRATKELNSSKIPKIHGSSRENTHLQYATQIKKFQEDTLFDIPPPIVGSITQHTHVQVC